MFLRGRDHYYVLRPTPFHALDGSYAGLIVTLQDVTHLRDQEARREHLVGDALPRAAHAAHLAAHGARAAGSPSRAARRGANGVSSKRPARTSRACRTSPSGSSTSSRSRATTITLERGSVDLRDLLDAGREALRAAGAREGRRARFIRARRGPHAWPGDRDQARLGALQPPRQRASLHTPRRPRPDRGRRRRLGACACRSATRAPAFRPTSATGSSSASRNPPTVASSAWPASGSRSCATSCRPTADGSRSTASSAAGAASRSSYRVTEPSSGEEPMPEPGPDVRHPHLPTPRRVRDGGEHTTRASGTAATLRASSSSTTRPSRTTPSTTRSSRRRRRGVTCSTSGRARRSSSPTW